MFLLVVVFGFVHVHVYCISSLLVLFRFFVFYC